MLILASSAAAELGHELDYWMIAPFVILLLCIAILPLVTPVWFEHLRNKAIIAAIFGVPVVVFLALNFGEVGREQILFTAEEYISFIVLLLSLFAISGGIFLSGDVLGSPRNNVSFLAFGAVLANFVGTTGAAMRARAAPASGQLRARLPAAHLRLHDLHRGQYRGLSDAARRPAALPGFLARCRLLLDAASRSAVAHGSGHRA